MGEKGRDHIPYRSSRLTHLLKDTLGGTKVRLETWGARSRQLSFSFPAAAAIVAFPAYFAGVAVAAAAGNSNTCLIANIWPEKEHLEETVSTLRFSQRMMRVYSCV